MTLPPLPEPDTHCWDEDTSKDVWSHSADQMRAYAKEAKESARAAIYSAEQAQIEAPLRAEIERLKDAVRSARADEAHRWACRVDGLTAQLREVDARYMALLKAVADGVAMQPRTMVLDMGPNDKFSGRR